MTAPVTQDNCTLLPCPFCGQPPELGPFGAVFLIHCGNCDCDVGAETSAVTEKLAIEQWNKRATPPADMEGAKWQGAAAVNMAIEACARIAERMADEQTDDDIETQILHDFANDIAMEIRAHAATAALPALSAPAADMEGAVRAAAQVMADLPTIDAPKLPAECWQGSARAILEGAVSALQRGGWQPIETAPKDGTYVLVTNGTFVDVSRWYAGSFGGFQKLDDSLYWMPLPAAPVVADDRSAK